MSIEGFSCAFAVLLTLFLISLNAVFIVFYFFLGWFYIPYILWILLCDRKRPESGGRTPWRDFFLWPYFRKYFPAYIISEQVFDAKKKYLFGIFPHGVLTMGVCANFLPKTDVFADLNYRSATLRSMFFIPFLRELLLTFGFVSVSKKSVLSCLEQNISVGIVVGGAEEAMTVNKGIVLDKRKGFVKIALQTGTPLVPVYTFGECSTYTAYDAEPGSFIFYAQSWMKRTFGFVFPVFWGVFFIFPKSVKLCTCIGKAIEVPLIKQPSDEEVDKWHSVFREQLYALHEKYRKDFNEDELKDASLV
jgi:1-acyl-sn-glycerol-3-phosphate acyltransferase